MSRAIKVVVVVEGGVVRDILANQDLAVGVVDIDNKTDIEGEEIIGYEHPVFINTWLIDDIADAICHSKEVSTKLLKKIFNNISHKKGES